MMRPAAGPQHALRGPLGDAVGGGQVGVEHRREVVLAHAQQQPVLGDAGVGDEHLDGAVGLLDRLECGVDLGRRRDVALDGEQAVGRRRAPL